MNSAQLTRMHKGKGFIAALDQSGGSTPKALKLYGIDEKSYSSESEMFNIIHQMRTRIITSPSFNSQYIIGAILFEQTMDRKINDMFSTDYLWEKKGIVPLIKVDQGLEEEQNDVCLMKPIINLNALLNRAKERNVFGTKMRSLIKAANPQGIKEVVKQQFDYALKIFANGLVPIIEPEIDINSPSKEKCEEILREEIETNLENLPKDVLVMFKFSLPYVDNFYQSFVTNPHVVRVVALSGGYTRGEADIILSRNKGVIASFSRAFTQGLNIGQSKPEFDDALKNSAEEIYAASIT